MYIMYGNLSQNKLSKLNFKIIPNIISALCFHCRTFLFAHYFQSLILAPFWGAAKLPTLILANFVCICTNFLWLTQTKSAVKRYIVNLTKQNALNLRGFCFKHNKTNWTNKIFPHKTWLCHVNGGTNYGLVIKWRLNTRPLGIQIPDY